VPGACGQIEPFRGDRCVGGQPGATNYERRCVRDRRDPAEALPEPEDFGNRGTSTAPRRRFSWFAAVDGPYAGDFRMHSPTLATCATVKPCRSSRPTGFAS
jgi:hypothetical protein